MHQQPTHHDVLRHLWAPGFRARLFRAPLFCTPLFGAPLFGAVLAGLTTGAYAQGPTPAPEWVLQVAGSDGQLDRDELGRALAEIDLDRRASGALDVALQRVRALALRLAGQPAGSESANQRLQVLCAEAELLLELGQAVEAWQLLSSAGSLGEASAQTAAGGGNTAAGAAGGAGAAAANHPRLAALRERAKTRVAESLGLSSPAPKNALEQAVEDALVASEANTGRLKALGPSAVPHLLTLCRRDRDQFPPIERRDPLIALGQLDPRAFLDLALAEFEAGGGVWRTRLLEPAKDLLVHVLPGSSVRSDLVPDLDRLLELLLREPITTEATWSALESFGKALHELPRVCQRMAECVNDPAREISFLRITDNMRLNGAVAAVAERLAASSLDRFRLLFVQKVLMPASTESPEARRILLGLHGDVQESIRAHVAEILSKCSSVEERQLRAALIEDPTELVQQKALESLSYDQWEFGTEGVDTLCAPLADPVTLGAIERASGHLNSASSEAWGDVTSQLNSPTQEIVLRNMLATGEQEWLYLVANLLRKGLAKDPNQSVQLTLELARAARALPRGYLVISGAISPVFSEPAPLAALLNAAIKEGLNELTMELTWSERRAQGQPPYKLQKRIQSLDEPTAGKMLIALCASERSLDAKVELVCGLSQARAEDFLVVMENSDEVPEVRMLAMAQALLKGAVGALDLLDDQPVWGVLENALEAICGGHPYPNWVREFERFREAPEPLRNALAERALSAQGLGEQTTQLLVSALSLTGPQGLELAIRVSARWGGPLKDSQDRKLLRRLLVESQALPAVPLDRELLRSVLTIRWQAGQVVEAIQRRGDPSLTALLGDELDRRRALGTQYETDGGLPELEPILGGLGRIGSPEALALLTREAQLNPTAKIRKACLEQLEALRRLDEASRWTAERGSLPRTRAQATAELLELLTSPDRATRLAAIEGLGALGQPEVLPDLVRLLSKAGEDNFLRSTLQAAISRIAASAGSATPPGNPLGNPKPQAEPEEEPVE
jgi:HEAT repeat protein